MPHEHVITHAQFAYPERSDKGEIAPLTQATQQLAQQLEDIQKQLALLTAGQSLPVFLLQRPHQAVSWVRSRGRASHQRTRLLFPSPASALGVVKMAT